MGIARAVAVALVLLASCAGERPTALVRDAPPAASSTTSTSTTTTTTSTSTVPTTTTTTTTTRPSGPVVVPYRVEVRSADPAVADFPSVVDATLSDRRGWSRAAFVLTRRDDAPYRVVLAEPADAQELCKPYDVYGKYSCQNGPTVVINADRWRTATPEWTGDLATYRQMLVNHEVGHLLGQRHPRVQCPRRGETAPVMAQQSTELNGCLPNPWPLPSEVARAARHDQKLAPAYGE